MISIHFKLLHSLSQNVYLNETYAGFKALAEDYFCIYYKHFYSVFLVLLTKKVTLFEPEVCKNGWDFSVADSLVLAPPGIEVYLLFIKHI